MPRAPVNVYWRQFCKGYLSSQGFWYVPKGEAVNDIPRVKERLSVLREKFHGQPWRSSQLDYVRELRRAGLFIPRARGQEEGGRGAIARMVKVVFDTLGLAWVNEDAAIFVSSAGNKFLDSNSPEEVIETQLWKYQLWNPSIRGEQYKALGVFPYALLTEVLLATADGITAEEYNLFVCRAGSEDSSHRVVDQIRRWRRLDEAGQSRIIGYLDSISTQSAKTGDKVSLYTRVARCQPYAWALFSSSGQFIERTRERLRIQAGRERRATQGLESHRRSGVFIDFENEKEWFSYYGDITVANSHATALAIYESRYDVARAVKALREARSRSLVSPTLTDSQYVATVVHERVIEDILEHQLELLEKGLTLYTDGDVRGRQFQTERGIIDLLARDSRGNWVVIELKRERAGDKVMGQTLRYIGWVKDNMQRGHQGVRGIIVGKQVDANLVSAARGAQPVPIGLFEFDFRLRVDSKFP